MYHRNTETFENVLKNPLSFLDIFYKRSSNYKQVKIAQSLLTDVLLEMKFDHGENDSFESLLEILTRNTDEKFTKKQICEHILTFFLAGLDTTAAHLNYTILFLAMHQEHQEKLFQELQNSISSHEEEVIIKLDYLDRIVKESFRLAPPIFLIGRETVEDFEILPGCIIPKSTPLLINTFVLHRSKDIYGEESNTFNPDNFLPEKVANRHPFSFLPFSTGRRNCIGYRFATTFVKIILANLITNFRFTTNSTLEDVCFKYGMTLKLAKNHLLGVTKRNN